MPYDTLASVETIATTIEALAERGVVGEHVATGALALARIKELIPQGASVMNGSSRTLEAVGFIDYLIAGTHGWQNLHDDILKEADPHKQATLRKQSVLSDYYLGSVHAVSKTGEMVIASNSGSQLPHIVFTSPHLIFVVGAHKITPDLPSAIARVREYVFPLEDARMKATGAKGSAISKLLIFEREAAFMQRTVHVIFVDEKVGF